MRKPWVHRLAVLSIVAALASGCGARTPSGARNVPGDRDQVIKEARQILTNSRSVCAYGTPQLIRYEASSGGCRQSFAKIPGVRITTVTLNRNRATVNFSQPGGPPTFFGDFHFMKTNGRWKIYDESTGESSPGAPKST